MKRVRIIPIITIDGNKMVKTVKFSNPNYLGDPLNAIKIFNDKEVDEIAVLDITASKLGKEPHYKMLEEMAAECFMPLAYGGGIKNLQQAQKIFSLGVEKIIINTSSQNNLALIKEISSWYGASSTLVSIDVSKGLFSGEKISFKSGALTQSVDVIMWAKQCEEAGAGEIILMDINRDGTFKGLNIELIEKVSSQVSIPVIACGGLNSVENAFEGIKAGAAAIAAGSFFAYKNNDQKSILINYPSQKELMEKIFTKL